MGVTVFQRKIDAGQDEAIHPIVTSTTLYLAHVHALTLTQQLRLLTGLCAPNGPRRSARATLKRGLPDVPMYIHVWVEITPFTISQIRTREAHRNSKSRIVVAKRTDVSTGTVTLCILNSWV